MAFESWHDYGLGIKTSDIKDISLGGLKALLEMAPNYKMWIDSWFVEQKISEPDPADYMAATGEDMCELACLMASVIKEAEGIELTVGSDCNDTDYLMYQAKYPWEMSDKDRILTKDTLIGIFKKYVSVLTDSEIEVEDQTCENFG